MKNKGFRTGNFVKSEKGTYKIFAMSIFQIFAIQNYREPQDSQKNVYSTDGTIIEPIPLTEKWLLDFGWAKGEYDTEYQDNISLNQEVLSYNVNSNMFCIETQTDVMEINHILYVHELQNLYFALTKQELTLKP
jgi:hypothetical protein